ncbi:MAG: aminotransferase class V-fold PLP-dependent enzyme [Gammaproteobacteria bacterium]|nr:aminotransferase class V-fold PLP-dependent enzyme [Gammaproteobacteria bacterium]
MKDFQTQFPHTDGLCHLNHAAMGPWPQCAIDALNQFAQENLQLGSSHYDRWLKTEHRLRQGLAKLINAPSIDDIALLKNTSEGLSVIAYGIDWQQGDEILLLDQEFPSNRIVWQSLRDKGVVVTVIDTHGIVDIEALLINQSTSKTRLITVSSVQYASGLRLDLKRISQHCQDKHILLCVDAIQSIGALPFDLENTPADFVVADGHKWLLGPEGIALFYCNKKNRDALHLKQYGWHMVEALGQYDRDDWEIAHSARRFECGSPNMLGIHALNASVNLLLEIGMDVVSNHVIDNTRYLIDGLQTIDGIVLLSAIEHGRHGGIVTFSHNVVTSETLYTQLKQNNIICAHRGGGVRFSPHFYITQSNLDYALNAVRQIIQAS